MRTKISFITIRRFLKTFLLTLPFLSCHSQTIPDFLKEERINGKVKAITEVHSDGQKFIYQFNENGKEIGKWFFNPTDVLLFRWSRKFDSASHLLEETHFDKGISPVLKIEYGYDGNGSPIGRTLYGPNMKPLEKYIYKYNPENKILDSIRYDFYGNLTEKFSWGYDSVSHLVLKTWFKSSDSSVITTTYEYNEKWKLIREKLNDPRDKGPERIYTYDGMGNLVAENSLNQERGNNFSRKFSYDKKGNMLSSAEYNPDGSLIKKFTYEYDSTGKKIREEWYNTKNIAFFSYTHLYDDKNNEIEMRGYNPSGEMEVNIQWSFEYDKFNNWTKRSRMINGSAGETITRLIEYF